MKKFFLLFCFVLSSLSGINASTPIGDIYIRDPFILADSATGFYYMYCSSTVPAGDGSNCGGVAVYKSGDMKNWTGPSQVCTLPEERQVLSFCYSQQ